MLCYTISKDKAIFFCFLFFKCKPYKTLISKLNCSVLYWNARALNSPPRFFLLAQIALLTCLFRACVRYTSADHRATFLRSVR